MDNIKVSIVLPSLNVVKYIEECLRSVLSQTLEGIEIICVDAGSNDGTLDSIKKFIDCDSRIKLLISPIKSYGYQMNMGIDAARGEYLGIVETDDRIERNMYERLYHYAKKYDLDYIKSDFYMLKGESYVQKNLYGLNHINTGRVFSSRENMNKLAGTQAIWTGLYRLDFLRNRSIRFLESPGASFQDTSFWFKVAICAERGYIDDDAYYYYRVDNEASSVKSMSKIFCICDELNECERYLKEHELTNLFYYQYFVKFKWTCYIWNLNRLDSEGKKEFIYEFSKDFKAIDSMGFRWESVFNRNQIDIMNSIIYNTDYCRDFLVERDNSFAIGDNIFRKLCDYKCIFIYGAGKWGKNLAEKMRSINKNIGIIWVVTRDESKDQYSIDNKTLDKSIPIVVSVSNISLKMCLYVNARKNHFNNIFVLDSLS